jgi:pimeloyl-ACP methyl ester carboxylesterase
MSSQAKELWIPHEQEPLMTAADYNTHEVLARTDLHSFLEDIDRRSAVVRHEFGDDGSVTFKDMRGDDEASPERALLLLNPFGNGDTPSMQLRARVYQAFLADDRRVISVPNNMFMKTVYELPEGSEPTAALAQNVVRGLVKHGITQVDVIGESQGGQVGAEVLAYDDEIEIMSVSLKDPPNTVKRTDKQLRQDFQGKGVENLRKLNQVIRMTGLPALVDAQHAHGGVRAVPQMLGLVRFQMGAMSRINTRLSKSMTERSFVPTLAYGPAVTRLGSHLQVVRYEDSAICAPEIAEDMALQSLTGNLVSIRYLGHEGTDHIVLNALLNRAAITGQLL